MTDAEIKEVKREGLIKTLLDVASTKLWRAREKLETAAQARFEKFPSEVEEARQLIYDAEQLWEEARKL